MLHLKRPVRQMFTFIVLFNILLIFVNFARDVLTCSISIHVDTMKASPSNNGNPTATDMSMEIEQKSRAYPIWIDKRHAVNSNSRPYGWCVSEDLASNDESPKGLLFVKVHKCSSSTGAGVTLRIQDGLSKRLNQPNQNQTAHAHGTCFAHYNHATASELGLEKRDPSQSFLWSIVREPAQRTLR